MRQRFGNLHQLLLGHAEVAHNRRRRQREVQVGQQVGGLLIHPFKIDKAKVTRLAPQPDILRHAQVGNGAQLLLHDGNPGRQRLFRVGELTALAVDKNVAAVGLDKAHQNAEKGGFSGAVAAAQRVD